MSQRLAERFAACKAEKRTAFVAFVTAGYPTLDATVPALLELEKNGADVIELGVPFSDPMADGSVIEAASVVALKNGVVYSDVLKYAAEARRQGLKVCIKSSSEGANATRCLDASCCPRRANAPQLAHAAH